MDQENLRQEIYEPLIGIHIQCSAASEMDSIGTVIYQQARRSAALSPEMPQSSTSKQQFSSVANRDQPATCQI